MQCMLMLIISLIDYCSSTTTTPGTCPVVIFYIKKIGVIHVLMNLFLIVAFLLCGLCG